jgi:type IV secretion system protein VirB1
MLMKATTRLFVLILFLSATSILYSQQTPNPNFATLSQACAPNIHKDTITALVSVESSFNPYAIGVVDGRLSRQPRNINEALSVVRELEEKNFNYSLGLSQVNKKNFPRLGINAQIAFDPCKNLIAGSKILSECYERARKGGLDEQAAVRAALS